MASTETRGNGPQRTRRSAREAPLGWEEGEEPSEPRPASAAPTPPPPRERYPMLFEVARQRRHDRLATAVRPLVIIPLIIAWAIMQTAARALMVAGWLAVFVTKSYPRWVYAALTETFSFMARMEAYATLLTDRFPSFNGEDSPVVVAWADPPEGKLSRWRVALWKLVILIPHFVAIAGLLVVQAFVTLAAWVAILATGRFPDGLFNLSVGIHRWRYRVLGYLASFNDRFPPFSPWPRTPPASARTVLTSGVLGFLVVGSFAGLSAGAETLDDPRRQDVDYAALRESGGSTNQWSFASGSRTEPAFIVSLVNAEDPDEAASTALQLSVESRPVTFVLQYFNGTATSRDISSDSATLLISDRFGDVTELRPSVATIGGTAAPVAIAGAGQVFVRFTFIIPSRANVLELHIDPPWRSRDVAFRFR